MKFSIKQLFVPVFLLFSAIAFPQDMQNSGFSGNLPVKVESGFVKQNATEISNAIRLEEKHKLALENGRDEIARQLESQIIDLIPVLRRMKSI